ncbi:MAG: M20/M25/M40 family metallo-hydrolase [Vicinamibacterales bacterium]|nr:M20/M25/M40 family metallo-hydrolase [Vicinamibacterales bacterium]
MHRTLAIAALTVTLAITSAAQGPVDLATVGRIRQEAIQRSQAIEHVWWLSEVHGPRVTGTPGFAAASEWAMARFKEWGLSNVRQERFAFGQGWQIERFSATMIEPRLSVLVGAPRGWSPSTDGPVTADVVRVDVQSEGDLAKHRGQLRGKIVLLQPVRAVRMLEGRHILRMTEAEWAEAAAMPLGAPAAATAAVQQQMQAAQALAGAVQRFLVAEGAAAVLDRGAESDTVAGGSNLSWQAQRVDGGTIWPGAGGSRDPKAPVQVPSATLAVEHYNRMVRLLERGIPVRMELNIQTRFFPEGTALNGINTIAEIPGTDLADEVVVMGAHLDSVPYAIGATDNATGSAAMMEAVRVIQALGLKPRRTIRVALWGGEEQGLLGARAHVAQHYYDFEARQPKPGHEKVAGYFNLDNGTGRIRGIWSQENLAAMALFDQWGATVKDLGWVQASPRAVAQTDHMPWDQAGIPGFQFIQERLEYGARTHHSSMDTFDRVQREDVTQQGAIAAVFAWHAANWPEKIPRKAP